MEAIDPDYYKNLQMILEHNLDDIGVELTFSIEDFSFGRRPGYYQSHSKWKKHSSDRG